jgi:hypothetical protein
MPETCRVSWQNKILEHDPTCWLFIRRTCITWDNSDSKSDEQILMFTKISGIIFFRNTEKCRMYVRYRLSDVSRNVFIVTQLTLHFQISPDLIFKPVCISSSNFSLGFCTYSSFLKTSALLLCYSNNCSLFMFFLTILLPSTSYEVFGPESSL